MSVRPARSPAERVVARAPVHALGPERVVSLSVEELRLIIAEAAAEGARQVVGALLRPDGADTRRGGLVDAAAVALTLGVTRQTVYQHAAELGGVRVGTGRKAPWRFDLDVARTAMACCSSGRSVGANPNAGAGSEPVRPVVKRQSRRRVPVEARGGSVLTPRPRKVVVG